MKWLWITLGICCAPVFVNASFFGMLIDPWAPWRFSGRAGERISQGDPVAALPVVAVDPGDLGHHGFVSDVQRYQLALAAGWSSAEAIVATAISIAEDGPGDPAALSPLNRDNSRDIGLLQINSGHWAEFGGAQALIDPLTNFRAGHVLYQRGGWNQWCTYPGGCGGGPGSPSWVQALVRARAAAATPLPVNQA